MPICCFIKSVQSCIINQSADDYLCIGSTYSPEETVKVSNKAVRNAMFLTVLYVFGIMLYRVAQGDVFTVDGSSFLIFLFINVLCLEFGIKKSSVNRLFRGNGR